MKTVSLKRVFLFLNLKFQEFRSYEVRVHVMSRINIGGCPRIFSAYLHLEHSPLEVKFTVDH